MALSILNEQGAGHVGPAALMQGIGEKPASSTHPLGLVDDRAAGPSVPEAAVLDTDSSDPRQRPTCLGAQDGSELIAALDVSGHRTEFSVPCLNEMEPGEGMLLCG